MTVPLDPDTNRSALWNACEDILSTWANTLEESLRVNAEPTDDEWRALQADLSHVDSMVTTLRTRGRA